MGWEDWMPTAPMKAAHDIRAALHGRDLLSIRDLSRNDLIGLLALAAEVRREPARYAGALSGKTLATIFEKPSLRTRVSFHVATCHDLVERLAALATIPVINGLTDFSHPCQALADYLTMHDLKGRLAGLRLAFVGDGNNVANSLIFGAALLGVRMTVASPPGYGPRPDILDWARRHETVPGTACRIVDSPRSVVFTQAQNRLHSEKALLLALMG
jgi:ornithine carbamoyltransferase